MTKLEELIYSLATVIVRYHDTQGSVTKIVTEADPTILRKKSRQYAVKIIQHEEPKCDLTLRTLIEECTKGYPDRKHLLTFILHEINFLKAQLERKFSFKSEELEEYKYQVTQLLIDFRQLLKTPKDKTHKVNFSILHSDTKTCIDLSGLLNNAYFGNTYCNSGLLVIEEVLERINIVTTNSDEEIREIALSLCVEHQNALLVSELTKEKGELIDEKTALSKKNTAQKKIIDELRVDLEKKEVQLTQLISEFQTYKEKKTKEDKSLASQPKPFFLEDTLANFHALRGIRRFASDDAIDFEASASSSSSEEASDDYKSPFTHS